MMSSIGGPIRPERSGGCSGACPRARSAARQLAAMPGCESTKVPSRSRRTEGSVEGIQQRTAGGAHSDSRFHLTRPLGAEFKIYAKQQRQYIGTYFVLELRDTEELLP